MPLHSIIADDIATVVSAPLPWDRFKNATVVISGAAGYLPAYMVETLLRLNDEKLNRPCRIIGLVRNLARARTRFVHHEGREDLQLLEQDICNPLQWSGDADFIIHAASQASPKYYGSDPVGTLAANTIGTHNLLQLARDRSVKSFLFFSSGEIYGRMPDNAGAIREADGGYLDPTDVRACYAEGKRAGETMCVSHWHQFQTPCRIVRPFHTYGPGMTFDDGRVFADFVANIVRGENITLTSDGSARRAFCYLADAVAGFFHTLLKGEPGRAYNVANPACDFSIRELAEILVTLFPEKKLKVILSDATPQPGYLPSRVAHCLPDISQIKSLGWRPSISVPVGFRRTVQSYL